VVQIEAEAALNVVRLVGLRRAVVVVHRLLGRRDEVLVRRGHHGLIEPERRVLVRPVGVHEAVFRDDVPGERLTNDASRTKRVGPRRQRIEDLVLMVARGCRGAGARRQQQQVREIAFEVLPVGWHGGRAREPSRRRVVRHRVVGEEKHLVAPIDEFRQNERTAEREGAYVLAAGPPRFFLARVLLERHLLLQVRRVHLVVPMRVVGRAAERVRTAARHHRDAEPRAVPLRSVEVRRLDAHFLDLIGVGRARDAAAEAIVRRAVDRVVVAGVAAVEAAARADLATCGARRAFHVPLEDVLHFDVGWGDAHRQARQHDGHVREHRQRLDRATIEVLARRNGRRVEERRRGHHLDRLADRADFHFQGKTERLPHGQRDAGLRQGLVTLQLDANRIRARIEQDGLEVAAGVGDQVLRLAGLGIRDAH
jgi:hypothetical protein